MNFFYLIKCPQNTYFCSTCGGNLKCDSSATVTVRLLWQFGFVPKFEVLCFKHARGRKAAKQRRQSDCGMKRYRNNIVYLSKALQILLEKIRNAVVTYIYTYIHLIWNLCRSEKHDMIGIFRKILNHSKYMLTVGKLAHCYTLMSV